MKRAFIFLLLITSTLILTGCKKEKVETYGIDDDIGNIISSEIVESLDNTSYIILFNKSTKEKITIENKEDVSNILITMSKIKDKISKDDSFVGTLLQLYFYDDNDNEILNCDVYDFDGYSDLYGRIYIYSYVNKDGKKVELYNMYYMNKELMFNILNKYIFQ